MAVAPFRYVSVDLVTGAIKGEIPLHDVSFTSILDGAGPMSASLRLPVDDLDRAGAYVDACEETRRVIYIEHGNQVVWAGPIWTSDYDTDTQTLKIQGAEMWSYWRRRRIRWDANYSQTDQVAIARELVQRSQQALGGNLHVAIAGASAGVPRDRTYRAFEDKQVAEAVEQLAMVDNGFDFAVEVVRTSTGYSRTFRCFYPRKGRTAAESGLIFTLGNNMLRLQLPRDGTNEANSVMAIGAGEGLDMLRATRTDLDALDLGYPLLEEGVSYKDVKVQATLTGHAQAELDARRRPISLPKATVLLDSDPALGTYDLGDEATLRVLPATEPRWPAGLEITARLNSLQVKPPDDGNPPTVDLIFEELNAA